MITASAVTAVAAAALVPACAQAQDASMFQPIQAYGTVGYAGAHEEGADVGALQGRLGVRFGRYVSLEGELSGGVKSDTVDVAGTPVEIKLKDQYAAYAVGFIPVTPHFDILGRVGYGHSDIKATTLGVSNTDGENSWNYGAGAQYTFDDHNGVRADYTRHDFSNGGGNADVWSIAYIRKF